MKALVTGATGFVGGLLAGRLLDRRDDLTALVRAPERGARLAARGARLVRGDLDDTRALATATAGQDVVFHVAGLVRARNEAEFLHANEGGTRSILRAAERAGVRRFVLVSSLAAAGPAERGRPLRGDEPERPVTPYGRSKLAAERVVHDGRIEWTIVRPPMVYGPGDRELLRVFRACRRGVAAVFGDGRQELCAVYGPDLAQALAEVAVSERTLGRTYVACHHGRFTSRELVCAIGDAVGRRPRIVRLPEGVARAMLAMTGAAARMLGRPTLLDRWKADEFFQPAWTADPAPLRRDAGWSAAHDLATGLRATAAWYRAEGWL